MSHGNIDPIQIIPIPGNSFESNTITITEPINDNESKYDHTGEYIASSSSYSSDDNLPAYAFNKVSNAFCNVIMQKIQNITYISLNIKNHM